MDFRVTPGNRAEFQRRIGRALLGDQERARPLPARGVIMGAAPDRARASPAAADETAWRSFKATIVPGMTVREVFLACAKSVVIRPVAGNSGLSATEMIATS
jgi:hypothetical protein